MKNPIIILLIVSIGVSCTPKVSSTLLDNTYDALSENENVYVFEQDDSLFSDLKKVGELKIGDSGFSTNCGYDIVLEKAKETARKSGANVVKITEVKNPGFASTCYRIKGILYRAINNEILIEMEKHFALLNESRLPEDADYSILYFYRPRNSYGSLIGYKVKNEQKEEIGRVRNGEKFEFKTKEFGPQFFYGKTESLDSLTINVKRGQEYFIRCGIKTGFAVGVPVLTLMENSKGIREYEAMDTDK